MALEPCISETSVQKTCFFGVKNPNNQTRNKTDHPYEVYFLFFKSMGSFYTAVLQYFYRFIVALYQSTVNLK